MRKNYYDYLEKNNIETGKILGYKYWIVEFPLQEYNLGAFQRYIDEAEWKLSGKN